jgi:cysteine desulfurase
MSVSSGSACSSAIVAPSHVLKAMGLSDQQAHASIRFSMGRFTTDEEVKMLVEEVTSALSRMQ